MSIKVLIKIDVQGCVYVCVSTVLFPWHNTTDTDLSCRM